MNIIGKELNEYRFIICGFDHFNTLDALRSLHDRGINPIVIIRTQGKKSYLVKNSNFINRYHEVEDAESGIRLILDNYIDNKEKGFLISCDDWFEECFDQHYDELKQFFYFFDGGSTGAITKYLKKDQLCLLAEECGFKIPKTVVVNRGGVSHGLRYPVITKSLSSSEGGWKFDVFICKDEQELISAYSNIQSRRIKLEEFIEKETELGLEGFSINNGKDIYIPFKNLYLRARPGVYGNYMEMSPFMDSDLYDKVRKLIRKSKFNGVFSVDFLIGKNKELYFLEVNFRHSAFAYATAWGGINLLYEWAKSTLAGEIEYNALDATRHQEPFRAMFETRDFDDCVVHGNHNFIKWLCQLKNADVLYLYRKDDPKPAWKQWQHAILHNFGLIKD